MIGTLSDIELTLLDALLAKCSCGYARLAAPPDALRGLTEHRRPLAWMECLQAILAAGISAAQHEQAQAVPGKPCGLTDEQQAAFDRQRTANEAQFTDLLRHRLAAITVNK